MVQMTAKSDTHRVRARKRAILLAASRLFRSKGFHATGMRDIAASAGMRVGNLYYYFRHKEEILAFCQEETLDRLHQLVLQLEQYPGPEETRLALLVLGHVRCLNEGIPGSLAHVELPEELSEQEKEKRDAYDQALRRMIRDGIRAGRFLPCDEKVAALAILGSVNWTVRWYRADGAHDVGGIGAAFAHHLVRGLLTEEALKTFFATPEELLKVEPVSRNEDHHD